MAIKAQLFTKIEGAACAGVKFDGFRAPQKAERYNRVSGVGKKGKFDIVSFFDKDGYVIKRVSCFKNDWNGETLKMKVWSEDRSTIRETIVRDGGLREVITDNLFSTSKENEILRQRERVLTNGDNVRDIHSFAVFSTDRAPRKIFYETKWDGNAPKVYYKNTKGELPPEGLEYLPLVISQGALPRYNHIRKIQEKALDIEGIAPPVRFAEFSEINPDYASVEEAVASERMSEGFTQCETGEVSIWNMEKETERLIEIFAHEFFHVWQFVCGARLQHNARIFEKSQDGASKLLTNKEIANLKKSEPEYIKFYLDMLRFAKKSVAKGIITKENTSPEQYWYHKHIDKFRRKVNCYNKELENTDDPAKIFVEVGAYKRQNNEVQKFCNLVENIDKVLDISS